MDYMQQPLQNTGDRSYFLLKLVNFEKKENHTSHQTQGLSEQHLVVRRGKPFKLTLLFGSRRWNPHTERAALVVSLGSLVEIIPVMFSDRCSNNQSWGATVYEGDIHAQSVTINICSPVRSSVGVYNLQIQIKTSQYKSAYTVGTFVLLCNPWLTDDPVCMPQKAEIEEYVKSDYGLVYMGSPGNVQTRPWSYGQYESGVLEACLALLQVSPQHQNDSRTDLLSRGDPVYLSLVICAMVNCNDDCGILLGRWKDDYRGGVSPTAWTNSADILKQWFSSKFKPVRYGQCWVFASVLCTVMRVLGIPSRVVTVFNAAHDTDANTTIEEYYTINGEKLNLSNDSVWNFHVWVECWMKRSDLGPEFDGWQVVDPTPQEKSKGIFRCGPCPVTAIKLNCFRVPYDTPFLYASVDGDIRRLIVDSGVVVWKKFDTETVGQLICTKSINSNVPNNLTNTYKGSRKPQRPDKRGSMHRDSSRSLIGYFGSLHRVNNLSLTADDAFGGIAPSLEVSLTTEGTPTLGENIRLCVKVSNRSSHGRRLRENINAQLKAYNSNPEQTFWKAHKDIHIAPYEDLTLHHSIPYSDYGSFLAVESVVNAAVVIKDLVTNESNLSAQEFSMSCTPIMVKIEGGDRVQIQREKTACVNFTNHFDEALSGAVLSVEGFGLLKGRQEARVGLLQPGEMIEKKVSIMATSHGTKLLVATLTHGNNAIAVSKSYHRVSV